VKNANLKSCKFLMFVKRTPNLASACYNILKIITRHGKSLSDGYYIKKLLAGMCTVGYCLKIFQMMTKSSSAEFADFLI